MKNIKVVLTLVFSLYRILLTLRSFDYFNHLVNIPGCSKQIAVQELNLILVSYFLMESPCIIMYLLLLLLLLMIRNGIAMHRYCMMYYELDSIGGCEIVIIIIKG